jgi:hypothetical protein
MDVMLFTGHKGGKNQGSNTRRMGSVRVLPQFRSALSGTPLIGSPVTPGMDLFHPHPHPDLLDLM